MRGEECERRTEKRRETAGESVFGGDRDGYICGVRGFRMFGREKKSYPSGAFGYCVRGRWGNVS